MSTDTLHVVTFNIHKGFSAFARRLTVHDLRDKLRAVGADVVMLQEVQGMHEQHAVRHADWPAIPQYEFLADSLWSDFAYGRNAVYDHGHHGNAILSRYPIRRWTNEDVSMSPFERRGLLHCEIDVPGWPLPLHCIDVHLGLLGIWRRQQMDRLRSRIEQRVPPGVPLIVAGDFNDWTRRSGWKLSRELGFTEVFEHTSGRAARSFPASMPVLQLDRIYVRGFTVKLAHVHRGRLFAKLSDHTALSAILQRQ